MIITLTLNPAVDKTILVRSLRPGTIHRVGRPLLDPAGKGINVARVANRLGCATLAFGVLAGEIGELAAGALDDEGVLSHFLWVPGETRLNVNIMEERTGEATIFVDDGPEVSTEAYQLLRQKMLPWLSSSCILVLAGRLPPGIPADTYAELVQTARSQAAICILDADVEPLRLGVEAGPYLIKPNQSEAEHLLGRALPDLPAVVDAARQLSARGIEIVVISLGEAGAVCASRDSVWRAIPPKVEKRSAVGSGDSMVAGLAASIEKGESIEAGLRLGTAAGAATAMSPGTAPATRDDIERLLPHVMLERLH